MKKISDNPQVEVLVNTSFEETRIAILEDGILSELMWERRGALNIVGNIYKAVVENVLPGISSAFLNIGYEKNAYLYISDVIEGDKKPIDKLLYKGQEIMVQVVKDAIGTKGMKVTMDVTLPGRYLVLTPNQHFVGVSKNLDTQKIMVTLRHVNACCDHDITFELGSFKSSLIFSRFIAKGILLCEDAAYYISRYLIDEVNEFIKQKKIKYQHEQLGWKDPKNKSKGFFAANSIGAAYSSIIRGNEDQKIGAHGSKDIYDKMIKELGGIDLQLLGIGPDGHIGFNEPDSVFVKETHEVKLDESTIKANARFFEKEEDVPKTAITMGMMSIMQAKKILLVANGPAKKDIVQKAFFGPVDPMVPASILQLHPDVTVIFSEE